METLDEKNNGETVAELKKQLAAINDRQNQLNEWKETVIKGLFSLNPIKLDAPVFLVTKTEKIKAFVRYIRVKPDGEFMYAFHKAKKDGSRSMQNIHTYDLGEYTIELFSENER